VSLPPGASADLSITLDGRTLTPGVFSGGVTVSTDDPSFAPREIPVTMKLVDESQLDNDHDGLTNGQERALGTDPNNPDSDGDGMPDGWEVAHGLNPLMNDASGDPDGDGFTNLQEYRQHTDPADYFNGMTPVIDIISGNNQFGDPGTFAAQMLTVRVRNSTGQPYKNALVTFTVPSGSGQLAAAMTPGALQGTQMAVRTNADGQASAAFLLSNTSGASSRITASTSALNNFVSAIFRAVTVYRPPPPPTPTPSPGASPSPTPGPTAMPAPPYRYAIIDLGARTYATRVNNKGCVLMTGETNPSGAYRFRWRNGVAEPLNNIKPDFYFAEDINDDGTVVGWVGSNKDNFFWWLWDRSGVNEFRSGLVWPPGTCTPVKVSGPATPSWVPGQSGVLREAYLTAITNSGEMYGAAYTGDGGYGDSRYNLLGYAAISNAQRWSDAFASPTALSLSHSTATDHGFFWAFDWQAPLDSVRRANSSGHYIGTRINPGPTVGVVNVFSTTDMIDGQSVDFAPVEINEAGIVAGWRGATMVIRTPGAPDQTVTGAGNLYPEAINDHLRAAGAPPSGTPDPNATPVPAPQILGWDGNATVLWERQADGQTWYPFGLEEMIPNMDGWSIGNVSDMNDNGVIVGNGWYKDPANPQAQWERHGFMLIPVDITVRKKGEGVSADGVLVKTGDIMDIRLNDIPPENLPLNKDQVHWKYRQLKRDGSFTGWQILGDDEKGARLEHTTTSGGIFQLEAVITAQGQEQNQTYVRKRDEPNATDSTGMYNEIYRQGQPDYIGVADTEPQIGARREARRNLGSTTYATSAILLLYAGGPTLAGGDNGDNKCNAFVYHKATDGGAPVPLINGHYVTGLYPPVAYDWWETTKAIPGWIRLDDAELPQPGYVVAGPDEHADPGAGNRFGHTGILDYDGGWIQAGRETVNKFPHLSTSQARPYQPAGLRRFTGP
jgi:hypothetical protein